MASQESTGAIKVVLLEAEDADCWGSTMPPLLHMLRASPGVVLFLADLDVLEALSPDTSACRQFVAELYDMLDSKQVSSCLIEDR